MNEQPTTLPGRPFRVVVLTCSAFGWETANLLHGEPGIEVVAVVSAPLKPRRWRARLRTLRKRHGVLGMLREVVDTIVDRLRRATRAAVVVEPPPHAPGIQDLRFADLHSPECLAAVSALAPDLGVVDGTYILRPELFGVPRLGSINLHCGKLPEYRGAPPAFWELMNGERSCGVSVHQVTAGIDEGAIFNHDAVPLDPAPVGDPVAYVHRYWLDVLRPVGRRLLVLTVHQLADGSATATPQRPSAHKTHQMPDHHSRRELRRRVAERRRAANAATAAPEGAARAER